MRAVTFQGVGKVGLVELAGPVLEQPSDVVVAVRAAAICGSDLHPYTGREAGLDVGTAMGHEFVGDVVEVGAAGIASAGSPRAASSASCLVGARAA